MVAIKSKPFGLVAKLGEAISIMGRQAAICVNTVSGVTSWLMSAAALKLELMGKDGDLGGAPEALERIGKELEKLKEFVIET